MRRVAMVNQKGGVGKTTTTVNLSAALALLGAKVLVIDMDPQSNTTTHFGLSPHECERTIYHVMTGHSTPEEVIQEVRPGLFLMPSNIELAGAEMELAGKIGRERVLTDAMEETSKGFDFIFVDCPPSLGLLNINGLTFVDEVFIPLQCEFFALQGISLLMRTVELVQKRLNPDLDVTGVIACMLDVRRTLAQETLKEIEDFFGTRVFKNRIRTNVRLAEAPSFGKTIFDYEPESNGARDYHALAREVLGLPPVSFVPPKELIPDDEPAPADVEDEPEMTEVEEEPKIEAAEETPETPHVLLMPAAENDGSAEPVPIEKKESAE